MPLIDKRPGVGGSGTITSVNGQTGPAVVLTAADVGAQSAVEAQSACPDNTITIVPIVAHSTGEVFVLSYSLKLNISGKERIGRIMIGFDSAIIFEDEYAHNGADIDGIDISADENAGSLRIIVDLNSVGEDTKFRYSLSKLTSIT
jgi:hypothetical protein